MTFAQFDSTKKPLEEILKKVGDGTIQLPDFQRGWVWDDENIRSILASISQSFPIGALMTLEAGGVTRFKPRPVEGAPAWIEQTRKEPEELILDGQQRLTSLWQATMRREVIETTNAQRRKIRRWYYFDMEKALDPEIDREDAIVGVPEDRRITRDFGREVVLDVSSPEKEHAALMFPVNRLYDPTEWQFQFFSHWKFAKDKVQLWMRFHDEVVSVFKRYYLPVITLHRSTPRAAVCMVFEKVNTGGKRLDAFELLTAMFASEEFDLRKDWLGEGGRAQRLAEAPPLAGLKATEFLQAVCLLHTCRKRRTELEAGRSEREATPVSCSRSAMLALPLAAYRELADLVEQGFLAAARFLQRQAVFGAKDIPYQSQLVPLAAVLAELGAKAEDEAVAAALARWFWCGALGDAYTASVEARMARDMVELPAWIAGGAEPATVREASFQAERLATLRSRVSAGYKALAALLLREGARELVTGRTIDERIFQDDRVDIHQIFPRAWCEKHGIDRDRAASVVNKTMLPARVARAISNHAPSAYVERLRSHTELTAEEFDERLRTHMTEPALLRQDAFDAFWRDRHERLLGMVERVTGRPVFRGKSEGEPEGDYVGEEPAAAVASAEAEPAEPAEAESAEAPA